MRLRALALTLLIPFLGFGQQIHHCGTEATQANIDYLTKTRALRQSFQLHGNKTVSNIRYVPIKFHIVRQNNGTGGLSSTQLQSVLDSMNAFYINANIQFFECGGRNYINNSTHYNFVNTNENSFCGAHDVSNVINIYMFNTVSNGSYQLCGYTRFPPSVDRVIMANSCALNYSTMPHELGHYFTLYHTHGKTNTGTTTELVNGSNCATDGDDVCDTPADPNLSGVVNSSCQYTGGLTDANNQPYVPDENNVMSYSLKACRNHLSHLQYVRIAAGLAIDRNYLVCSSPPAFAQFDYVVQPCGNVVSFSDFSTNGATSVSWDFGDGSPTSSATNPTHTYTSSGTYNVRLTATNGNGSTTALRRVQVNVSLPVAPVTVNDTVFINQQANLTASGAGVLNWYTAQTGGNYLASGSAWTTPPLPATTSYWVEDSVQNPIQKVGPANNSIGTGANFNNDQHLVFDVLSPCELVSVLVYATNGPKNRTIELRDNYGTVLQSATVNIPNGTQRVNLGFQLTPGVDYQLGLSAGSIPQDLYRNNAGPNYPYTIPGLISIKRSSAGSNPLQYYYFYYDWEVREPACESPRSKVDGVVQFPVGIDNASTLKFNVYPNPVSDDVNIEFSLARAEEVTLDLLDISGKVIRNLRQGVLPRGSNKTNVSVNDLEQGIYQIRLATPTGSWTKKLAVVK